jgi:hypothetical protein
MWGSIALGVFGGLGGGIVLAALHAENKSLEKRIRQRNKSIEGKRRAESNNANHLSSVRKTHKNTTNNVKSKRKQNTELQKKTINEEVNRDKTLSTRNNYRDNIVPNLETTKSTLQSEFNDMTDEHNISDTKNKALLSGIVGTRDAIEYDKLNIFGKTQQVHDQINKQNHYLEQTFQGLTQKRINLDRRSTYENHIKMEYLLANVALWYVYYLLLAVLFFMYRKQENLKQPRTIVMMIGLLLFPYWMVILEVITTIIVNMPVYAKQFAEILSRIPNATNKLFESLF